MSEENNEPEAPAQLGVADLQNAAQIIDAAVSRGAFKASEAAQVGAVYNKIQTFIQSVVESQNQENSDATATPAANEQGETKWLVM